MEAKVLLFKDNKYVETKVKDNLLLSANARLKLNGEMVMLNDAIWELYSYIEFPGGGKALLLPCAGICYSLINQPVVKIGKKENDQLRINHGASVASISNGILIVQSGAVYLNGTLVESGGYQLSEGDTFFMDSTEIRYQQDHIVCIGKLYTSTLNSYYPKRVFPEEFPKYTRSPRIIKREPSTKIDLKAPKEKPKGQKGGLVKMILPPVAMAALTLAMGMMMGRGIYMLVTAAGTVMTTVFSITNFFDEKKELKKEDEERIENYDNYLLRQRKTLNELKQKYIDSKAYHNPTVQEIEEMIATYSNRIYERRDNDGDFLQFSIGLADCEPTYEVSCTIEEVEVKKDPLYLEMQNVYEAFKKLHDVPTIIDLKNAHLGIVGESEYIHTQLKAIVAQLTFMQSYHDIEIITLVDEKSRPEFEWIKWYPHCKLNMINVSGLVSGENQRDQVLGSITQIMKQRKQYIEESKKDTLFTPHYIFIIDNPNLLISHSLMEYLQVEQSELGFSLIYTTHLLSNLPDNIKTVMTIETRDKGTLLLNEGELVNQPIKLHNIDGVDLEGMARGLAPLNHNKGVSTQIPESITFFDLYNVKHPTDLPVKQLWMQNAPHKSLAVPLGVRAKDDIVYLNLHEKSHGPHGLVAGTTGSGKSEILQSYILSLAVNFHPYDVGFLLIDYKGGGMANLFKDLPHLMGTITNLDGSESFRALASIKSELARRQRVFNEHEVNAINQYTKLFKEGKAKEPLPHLFLISDEFAELKKEQPDFMRELVSAARIGRSLGVHLILATQKPSGVVDDQIWSNSKFKLALKVQNESDSKEVLKTPDAARITQPGRAYLQVGNNEIYELFQSAWSGADYSLEREKQEYDNRVYLVNELGQGVLINEDLSDTSGGDSSSSVSQLDATVAEIKKVYDASNSVEVAKPWLPPLEQHIVTPHINIDTIQDVGRLETVDTVVKIGMVDIPDEQAQVEYSHDFITDGNLGIFGASGFGKSTVEMQIALTLAVKNSPRLMKYYIIDLGNSSLIQLKGLPHTADYLSFDDTEKLNKLIKLLQEEVALRKKLFAKENAINFNMYNTVAKDKLPVILLFVDNYDVIKEIGYELEESITKITRDGVGLGIFTIITASRSNSVRYAVLNNFKNKICNFMFDQSDIYSLVGRSSYTLPEIRGRAMIKLKDVCIMQEYLPVSFDDEVSYAKNIRAIIDAVSAKCSAAKQRGIPVLPDVLSYYELMQAAAQEQVQGIAVGLDTEEVLPQVLDRNAQTQLIVGTTLTGKTNFLKLILSQMPEDATIFISDSKSMDLNSCASRNNTMYMSGPADAKPFVDKLAEIVEQRKELYAAQGNGMRPRDFYAALPRVCIFIDDGDYFVESCKECSKELEQVMPDALVVGAYIYTTTVPGKLRGYDNVTKLLKDTTHGIILGNPADQSVFQTPFMRNYKPQQDMGLVHRMGQNMFVKIPFADV